jgi:hypothetical protein
MGLPNMISRREMLHGGLLGLSLSQFLGLRAWAQARSGLSGALGRAKSCIVLYCWGGMSHLESWDPKPDAPLEIRGEHKPIATATPGIYISEYLPHLAKHTGKLAILRAVHHKEIEHKAAACWSLTGHAPRRGGDNNAPSKNDRPGLGPLVASQRPLSAGLPGTVTLPGLIGVVNQGLVLGQGSGFLGPRFDPIVARPKVVSKATNAPVHAGCLNLDLADGVDASRLQSRLDLGARLEAAGGRTPVDAAAAVDQYRHAAVDMLGSSGVRAAFDLEREPDRVRQAYGNHLCGQSILLARRLTEAGVPVVTVYCANSEPTHVQWDTHGNNFETLKKELMPPLDQGSSALLTELAERGRLAETLIVWLTEFGRTPLITGKSGREHHPYCYSLAMAGGGIKGGIVYGSSDRIASRPKDKLVTPPDISATLLAGLGIDPAAEIVDSLGRPLRLSDGQPIRELFE